MPTDPSKAVKQLQELPENLTSDQLQSILSDRIKELNQIMRGFVQTPAIGDVDLGDNRITRLHDPKEDLDGVNLRTLKHFAGIAVDQGTGKGSGVEQPTIYFTFDGLPFNGEASPYAPILDNRSGFSPVMIGVTAVGPPTSGQLEINAVIFGKGNMLSANLVLPVGSRGPTFSTGLALSGAFTTATLVQGVIVVAGGASQITIGLWLRGT